MAGKLFTLKLSMFIMGACGVAYEYTLSKISSDLLGNSTQQWALIIGTMMFFMGVGADYQKRFQEKLVEKFIFIEIFLALAGGFAPNIILWSYGEFNSQFILIQYFFIGLIGLLIGLEIPLMIRIYENYAPDLKINLSTVLKLDYVGALMGSLIWAFVLPRYFTYTETAFILSFATLLVAIATTWAFRHDLSNPGRLVGLGIAIAAYSTFGIFYAENWASRAEQYLYRDHVVWSKTTKYQHLVLTKQSTGDFSLFINGHLQFHSADEHIYHENLVHPAFSLRPDAERVLILGGGDGMAAREVLKYSKVKQLVLCDLDPEMTRLAKENPEFRALNNNALNHPKVTTVPATLAESNPLKRRLTIPNQKVAFDRQRVEGPEVLIYNLDAVNFLAKVSGFYDIIILDFPDPNMPELAKLYARSFYQLLQRKLTAKGIIVQQSTSPQHARKAFLTVGKTMRSAGFTALPYHDTVPSFGNWGFWIAGSQDFWQEDQLRHQLENATIPVATYHIRPDVLRANLVFGGNILDDRDIAINKITDATIYRYYQEGWQQM